MGLWPTKADGNPLANARGSAWDAHCKQSRDRKGALEVWTFKGADSISTPDQTQFLDRRYLPGEVRSSEFRNLL